MSADSLATRFEWELAVTWLALGVTLVAWLIFLWLQLSLLREPILGGHALRALQILLFTGIVSFLVYGSVVYCLTRLGYFSRRRDRLSRSAPNLNQYFDGLAPSLTILIPSYREELKVVRKTILSAALQNYPELRVVLLIDDPPEPADANAARALEETYTLVAELREHFRQEYGLLADAYQRFRGRYDNNIVNRRAEVEHLSALLQSAYRSRLQWARSESGDDHEDVFFRRQVALASAQTLSRMIRQLRASGDIAGLDRAYRHSLRLCSVDIVHFERKRFVNLSHDPNKAMNLNSYLGLIGRSWAVREEDGVLHLEPAAPQRADFEVPESDFVITLDADSLILPEYSARLVEFMMRPENHRVAVVQTPYSAFPGARRQIERIAGATTDIQYQIHQGFTSSEATYWVGANALMRFSALQDIKSVALERGFVIHKSVQDRTVIEDTESTVDLVEQGWSLHNYLGRLAYSATPPDFGSLIIQRRRWANGGLIILPKLLRNLLLRPGRRRRLIESSMRIHYLASITGANVAMLLLMFFPFDNDVSIALVMAASLPYLILYARDLRRNGYRYSDVFRVYALNLMLIPVNIGGILKSLEQIITGRKSPFARTPKVTGRTTSPARYILAEWGLALYCVLFAVFDLMNQNWLHGAFGLLNGVGFWYAILVFIGMRAGLVDVRLAWQERRRRCQQGPAMDAVIAASAGD